MYSSIAFITAATTILPIISLPTTNLPTTNLTTASQRVSKHCKIINYIIKSMFSKFYYRVQRFACSPIVNRTIWHLRYCII